MPKVIVGMSGGVDSSITAFLLREQGYEVEGISFILWESRQRTDFATCCSMQAIEEASETASRIGTPHSVIDVRDAFIEKVIEPFVDAYTKGLTPNPCILCNRYIKFPFLLKEAEKRGADFIATGHYARIVSSFEFRVSSSKISDRNLSLSAYHSLLLKGIDPKKDQSYFLYVLRKEELNKLLLPLGEYKKEDVRRLANKLKLPSAQRPESQEICFIEDRNYFKFINKLNPLVNAKGHIVDMDGNVLGEHNGIYHYTVGQRKGLGISSQKPMYVVKIDALKNIVHVGPQEAAEVKEFEVRDINWLPNLTIQPFNHLTFRATVRVRSMMNDAPATIYKAKGSDTVKVIFDMPQWAPAPGQSAVFYDRDVVIGGGVIR
ncbi:MAG: tRNA 2-thiouridine(34) synthase MnmA [Nitrospirae bacterium]|nr:tRNA 2-thiouridine(34) synthase MnmA [Nitrospirota bacterium]